MDAETTDRPASSDDPRPGAADTTFVVAPPYDVLLTARGWPSVFSSIGRQMHAALSEREAAGTLSRSESETLGRLVLTAVVADVLEPDSVATLLTLHHEAVDRRLLPEVSGVDDLSPEATLVEAREASSPALLAVEAGVYGIVGDVVRATLSARN